MARKPQKRRNGPANDGGKATARPAEAAGRDNAAEGRSDRLLTVGIGASAGGLEAFKTFFSHMPAESGMAFVLVQHLAPGHKSMLTELIGRATAMPVTEAADGMPLSANEVFVIPPDATLTLEGGRLRVATPAPPREHRRPIDTFFASLADDQGENAVAIVLSGTGSDGSAGLSAIKENGGFTMAQAEFDHSALGGMPHNAVATGFVDDVMLAEDMPARLLSYHHHLREVAAHKEADGTRSDAADYLETITRLLRAHVGHDFSRYKEKTLVRRIQRRMQVLQTAAMPEYIALLKDRPSEIDLLFRELLIGVTQFFRDPRAFDALAATVIPRILESRRNKGAIRVWVPGCATGQEVYSVAILIREAMDGLKVTSSVQIFGTDIDEKAVAVARAARYDDTVGISPERVRRWFAEDAGGFCPVKEIREMCVFSPQSIIKDPPLSKVDLICCRNTLIYMTAGLQDRVLRTFHYALNPDGILFLGPSEGVTRQSKYFASFDKKHRIFQRRDASPSLADLPSASDASGQSPRAAPEPPHAGAIERIDRKVRQAMEKYSPAYLVIDGNGEILRFSGGEVGRYLEPTSGAASLNLYSILRKALRPAVRAAVRTALATEEAVVHGDVMIRTDGGNVSVSVIVEPIRGKAETGVCVVAFREARASSGNAVRATDDDGDDDGAGAAAFEHELRTVRTQLRSTIDELEAANEEMKSSAEEYQSVNEELQSANEELETSKEEMQSLNEELQTVNAEVIAKNEQLLKANSDIRNLLDSTEIATLFLDEEMRIKSFTPRVTEIFSLREADRGRPITDIVMHLDYRDLVRDVRSVCRDLSTLEREVTLDDDKAFILRIRPYRTVENRIDGVVLTFMDISERKKSEQALQRSERRYRELFEAIDEGFCIIETVDSDPEGRIDFRYIAANPAFAAQTGVEGVVGKTIREMFPDEPQEWFDIYQRVLTSGEPVKFVRDLASHGRILELFAFPLENEGDRRVGVIFVDISERIRAEERTALILGELDHRVKNILAVVSSVISQTLRSSNSPSTFAASMEGRIAAIARAHSMLTQEGGRGEVSLQALIETELAPFDNREKRIKVEGPEVMLTPRAGLTLAMAIHELTSNASKYGALSTGKGRLSVTWSVNRGPADIRMIVTWAESDGPPVLPPKREGFGTTLIDRTLGHDLDANVNREFASSGMRCAIDLPMTVEVGRLAGQHRNREEAT